MLLSCIKFFSYNKKHKNAVALFEINFLLLIRIISFAWKYDATFPLQMNTNMQISEVYSG